MSKAVVLFSGGVGSWAAAMRTVTRYGVDNVTLLFTDTRNEDEDLYRFLPEAAAITGAELVTVADGRDVWELFFDEKFIGNTRADLCSRVLKRDLARTWIETNTSPVDTAVVLGIDWTEIHRFERAAPHWLPWRLEAPLCDPPLLSRDDVFQWLAVYRVKPPRLYQLGFPHNNCGGFCVKQGQAAFQNLLRQLPDRYAYHEAKEQEFRDTFNKDVAILRDRTGGTTTPLTLTALRDRVNHGQLSFDGDDWGGCGCMVDFD